MLQDVMLIGLGFLTAVLIALLLAPPFRQRAVNLTTKHIRARSPLTMAEIQADRDQIRAKYAIDIRKLEVLSAQMTEKLTHQSIEISNRVEEVGKLKSIVQQQTGQIEQKDERLESLSNHVATLEEELKEKVSAIAQQKSNLSPKIGRFKRSKAKPAPLTNGRIEPVLEVDDGPASTQDGDATTQIAGEVSALVAEISEISKRKTDLEERRIALTQTAQNIASEKEPAANNLKENQMKLTALEVERARMLADLTGLEQTTSQINQKLAKLNAQPDETNPHLQDMALNLETLETQMTMLRGQLAKEDANAPQPAAALKKANSSAKSLPKAKAKDGLGKPGKKKRAGSNDSVPTLTDRIRALQNEPAQ